MNLRGINALDAISVMVGIALIAMSLATMGDEARSSNISTFCGFICFIPLLLKLSGVVTVPTPLTVLAIVAPFLHGFGLIADFYTTVDFYDTITHTLSSMTIAICVFYVLIFFQNYGHGRVNFAGTGLALFTSLIAMTFSVYWEVMEYSSDILFGSTTQYSPFDTLTDLVCDAAGTVLASMWVAVYMRNRTIPAVVDTFNLHPRILDRVSGSHDGD